MVQPGYLLVVGQSFERKKMGTYSAALPPIYQAHGGFYLGIGGGGRGVEHLEGGWSAHSAVLAQFPDKASVNAFWTSDAYKKAKQLRVGAGTFQVSALKGIAPPPSALPGYLISLALVLDRPAFDAAAKAEAALIAGAGMVDLVRSAACDVDTLEGDPAVYDVAIVASPTVEAARTFWNAAEFVAFRAQRAATATVNTFLMAGIPRSA